MLLTAPDRDVVGSYSYWKSLPILSLFFLMAAVLISGWYSPKEDFISHIFHHGIYRPYATIVGTGFFLILLPRLLMVLNQVLFDHMRAVWIEDNCLVYLNKRHFMVRGIDISSISVEPFGRYKQTGITVRLKNGGQRILPTGTLSERADVILDRIKASLCVS